jgi:hypothetical protein
MNLHCIIHSFLQVYILGLLHERWWVLFQVEYYIALTCMQYPKGHVSYCYQVAYINFSHFHLLLKNHWTNMNQTYILSCDSVTSNNTLSWYTSIWSNFDLWVSEATLIYEYLKQLWFMSIWSNFDLWVSEATLIYEYLKQLWFMSIWSNFQQHICYIMGVSLIGGGNERKPLTCCKSQTNLVTKCCIEYTLPWMEI